MSGKLNFSGVEEAKESLMTRPGTKDVFEITEVKFDASKNKGTYYMGVKFTRKQDSFTHSFFLTEKALPRVKSLVKWACGVELDSEVVEEQLSKMLTGKKIALKVTGKIDETNGRAYPDLSFGGFGKEAGKLAELEFNEPELEKNRKAAEAYAKGPDAADKEDAGVPAGTTASAPAKAEDDPFM